jgi:hypothetical protein
MTSIIAVFEVFIHIIMCYQHINDRIHAVV